MRRVSCDHLHVSNHLESCQQTQDSPKQSGQVTLPSTLSLSLALPKRMHKSLQKPIDSPTNLTLILQSLAVFLADSPKHPVRWNLGLHSTISSSYLPGSQPSAVPELHKLPALSLKPNSALLNLALTPYTYTKCSPSLPVFFLSFFLSVCLSVRLSVHNPIIPRSPHPLSLIYETLPVYSCLKRQAAISFPRLISSGVQDGSTPTKTQH
jgi:hypothetical protein